jgi:hypothetical protein
MLIQFVHRFGDGGSVVQWSNELRAAVAYVPVEYACCCKSRRRDGWMFSLALIV